ncbi:MFS general substrate transporter [Aspergillus vadensis CBS 113365]|uniref:MFS general substrate transporter n=1 Tax=Aspergillus vadensis (strain CBS 113365 / IMI 142717 / IBT 24658) TaxID=1448311 RepID=A0A319C4X4_ASPVC|nr:MFS general substrate transporter [Aspergillus vadensis CBS 113365]PYH73363.1 MFS general substrate transporter [Aspergillus vadensis CBS 113365]
MSISVVRSPIQGAPDTHAIEPGHSRFKECLSATPPSRRTTPDSQADDRDDRDDSVPDGGTAAWLIVVGGWCAMFSSYGWLHSIGVFQNYYQNVMFPGYPASTIAWIPSFEVFFMLALGPIVGRLSDTFGPRAVIIGGSFFHIFGVMMASISTKYYQILLAQGVCSPIGLCAIAQPVLSVMPSWFNKRRGLAYGIISSSGVGFGWAMRITAFMMLLFLIVAGLTVRERVPPRPEVLNREVLLHPFRDVNMVVLLVGGTLLSFGVWCPSNYIVTSSLAEGMQTNLSQYLVSIQNAGSLLGRFFSGIFADKFGPYNSFIFLTACCGILVLALWMPGTSNSAIIVFDILFGITSGAYYTLVVALVAPIAPPQEIGYWAGLNFFFASIAGLVTGSIGGAILAHDDGSYWGMKVYSGVLLLVGSVIVLGTRLRLTGLVLCAKC